MYLLTPLLLATIVYAAEVAAPVAEIPYWTYLIPVLIAAIGAGQTIVMAIIAQRVKGAKESLQNTLLDSRSISKDDRASKANEAKKDNQDTKDAVNILEKQINSNLERQIEASINKAIADERLRVAGLLEPDSMAVASSVKKAATDAKKSAIESKKKK